MGFAKVYDSITDSSLWKDHDATRLFITAMTMAKPHELRESTQTIRIGSLEPGDYVVPTGWYGLVPASSDGLIRRALLPQKKGLRALQILAAPDPDSRSDEHDGRRLVRVTGGFLVLNFMKYRDRDETAAERQRRFRERKRNRRKPQAEKHVTPRNGVTPRDVTESNAIQRSEAEADAKGDLRPPVSSRRQNADRAPTVQPAADADVALSLTEVFAKRWAQKYGRAYYVTEGDHRAMRLLVGGNPEIATEWPGVAENYLATEGFFAGRRHPLEGLAKNPNEFRAGRGSDLNRMAHELAGFTPSEYPEFE